MTLGLKNFGTAAVRDLKHGSGVRVRPLAKLLQTCQRNHSFYAPAAIQNSGHGVQSGLRAMKMSTLWRGR
jgi:hypothetical protein